MISAIFDVLRMIVGVIIDIVTLPFRIVLVLLGGAEFTLWRFSKI